MSSRAENVDVDKQIRHMMAFIEQEANEKVEEIDAKAEEEFNIEKGRLVHQQRVRLQDYYDKRLKQVNLQKKILSSNLQNQSRLSQLKARENHIHSAIDEARRRLVHIASDTARYKQLLLTLIQQGIYQLMEKQVTVHCRQADVSLVQAVLPDAVEHYRSASGGKHCQVHIDDNHLPADTCGGVELSARGGKMRVVNLLESRLDLLSRQAVPEIRTTLFGRNTNRKFDD